MHIDMFSGMYTSQGPGDMLVRICGSWEKIMVDQRRCRRILKQVKQCVMPICAYCALTRPARIFKSSHAYSMYSGIYTGQGSGDILVRMCGSWEKIIVDQRKSRRILKQVKQCVMPICGYCALLRPPRIFKCSHACRHVQGDVQ